MDLKGFLSQAASATKEGGLRGGARFVADQRLDHHAAYYGYRALGARRTFRVGGEEHSYFYHKYNHTWRNERSVEVPIGWRAVERAAGKRVLEVGNVLAHYFPVKHDVVDKYEKAPGVMNEDVVDYEPKERYDLIVTLSTLEHVGWDESPREPQKIHRAIRHLKERCLAPGGRLVATVPVGHHPEVANFATDDKTFTRVHYLKRLNLANDWIETTWSDVANARCGTPHPGANAVVVGVVE